jgi:CrcB protein
VDLPVPLWVSLGGVAGALTRYTLSAAVPGGMWVTCFINVSGCFLIGALYERPHKRPWVRPLLGTGFLGGYTTFSTAMVDTLRAQPTMAVLYCGTTLLGAVLAVLAGRAARRTR